MEIPIKNKKNERYFEELCTIIKKDNNEIKEMLKKSNEKVDELEKKINKLEKIIVNLTSKEKQENILFEKSTIIKTDFERKLLESFIKENDASKKIINISLLFKATVDGDTPIDFHKKCDYKGATLTIEESDSGKRFGAYSSVSWDQMTGGWVNSGVCFLFSLDTRKYYKNTTGNHFRNHSSSHNPEFGGGHDLTISTGCLSNSNSYTNKYSYDMTSAYELNGGIQNFKVLDYEVFQV